MQFKTFNQTNAPHKEAPRQNKRFTITIHDSGLIVFSKMLHDEMGKPSAIEVLQDLDYLTDFYIKPVQDPKAFQVKNLPGRRIGFRSNGMTGIMAKNLALAPPYVVKFQVRHKEDGLYCICTKNPITKK